MALTHIARHYCPNDGTVFKTTANLNSILRATSLYNDDMHWPEFVSEVRVPVYVRMEKYKAQETRQRPDGMMYGPVVRVGTMDSPEVPMFGMHHAAGLTSDYKLDYDQADHWLYYPLDYAPPQRPPGADASLYLCDQCHKHLYRDDLGRRDDCSATIYDGALVCRDCDVRGLVAPGEMQDRLERCRRLARRVGCECLEKLERSIGLLTKGLSWGAPSQTRLYSDGKWSFGFSMFTWDMEGKKHRGMNGGLIQHGPHPKLDESTGEYTFTLWDYAKNAVRAATCEEIAGIEWSIHT